MSTISPESLKLNVTMQPSNTTILIANIEPSTTYIVLPQSGTLTLVYEVELGTDPVQQIFLSRRGGSETIQLGENTFQVSEGDLIVYTLKQCGGDSMKLVWWYQEDVMTTLVTGNNLPGQLLINLPQTGNLWVAFEGQPKGVLNLWQPDGQTNPIQPGFSTIHVDAGDALYYELVNCATDPIKIGWAYV